MDWSKYAPYFKKEEFTCKHTGENEMKPEFMDKLLAIRKRYGKPMWVLLKIALEEGMTGIGVQQKGSGRFLHLDDVTEEIQRPWIWSY